MNNFNYTVLRHSKINNDALVIFSHQEKIISFGKGIVFIFAEWSASSINSFIVLTEILNQLSLKNIKIYVFNADTLNPKKTIY